MTGTLEPKHKKNMTRRRAIIASGGAVAAAGIGVGVVTTASAEDSSEASGAGTATATATATGEACYVLTSEVIEGPYYIDADKIRRDVTEDQVGIPLTLSLKVIDAETCKPLKNAAVDIWSCNALGIYSGFEAAGNGSGTTQPTHEPSPTATDEPSTEPTRPGPTDDKRYLRGTYKTDAKGAVTFETIFPGWYQGRAIHIHTKVHVNGEWTDAGYEGGNTCHTGQLFFEEEAVLASAEIEPYSTNTVTRVTLDEDHFYPGNGTEGGLLKLTYKKKNDISKGVIGSITMAVDPDATNEGDPSGGGGGGGGGTPSPTASASAS